MELKNKKILILGLSVTGLGVAKFLCGKGADCFISEFDKKKENSQEHKVIQDLGAKIEFGGHSLDFIQGSEFAIISPSIPQNAPVLKLMAENNVEYMSDIEFISRYLNDNKKFAVITGTNGKTTTTMLVSHILSAKLKAPVCGNIGISPLEVLYNDPQTDCFVCEMSSYQAHYSNTFAPHIAIFCNLTPDHISFHGSVNEYFEAKAKIFRAQTKNDYAILNADDSYCAKLGEELNSNVIYFSTRKSADVELKDNKIYFKGEYIIDVSELPIVGEHNVQNVMSAVAAAKILGIENEVIKAQIKTFKAAPHRCEFIAEKENVKFYNDSKATNPEATIVALRAFPNQKVVLIAGGRDKNTSLDEFCEVVKENIAQVVLIGEATERFESELKKFGYNKIVYAKTLNEAINISADMKPDVVLLSPACASFDMFKSFEDRGEKFREYVLSR
ncbi:UDP-N-acetylmuramoyl-L-alanine--D-glutamate ligase [bacterium]|nr:UDP-N-acetylmuramoyl-L-alanine--D-glutamate ligase [bacterium]